MVELDNKRRIKKYNLNKTKFLENYRSNVNSQKKYFLRIHENRIISRTYSWGAPTWASCEVSDPDGEILIKKRIQRVFSLEYQRGRSADNDREVFEIQLNFK